MNPLTRVGLKLARQINNLAKSPRQHRAAAAFDAVALGRGDVAIDCGANVGEITARMAANGATVHAFEPSPIAFEALTGKTAGLDSVVAHQCAVSDHDGTARLYLHRKFKHSPLGHSAGSSLKAAKHNLDPDHSIEVPTIDLADFIESLPSRVRVLKIDIEGLEVMLINHLIDRGVLDRIDQVFCETHEFKVPGLLTECRALRRRLAIENICHVNLDWA
ncbi:MAG: FkbM family methyltransferase [Wenzhouxiangella sp.]|nr:MAG: FkbM family methyltransferase [Wenzhouxiangella sp.]